jgi:membrane fusion protein (multidrug efflux system)
MARQREVALKLELQRIADELAGGPDTPINEHPDYRIAKAEPQQARAPWNRPLSAPRSTVISASFPSPDNFWSVEKLPRF